MPVWISGNGTPPSFRASDLWRFNSSHGYHIQTAETQETETITIIYNSIMRKKYTKELLLEIVSGSKSIAEVLSKLSLSYSGGNYTYIFSKLKQYNISTSHFLGKRSNLGKSSKNKKSAKDILVLLPESSYREKSKLLKRSLLESGRNYKCDISECSVNGIWHSKEITLHVDHIDGNFLNNRIDNLRFLCPNCHSQTSNFGSLKYKQYFNCVICNKEIKKNKSGKCFSCVQKVKRKRNTLPRQSQRKVERPTKEELEILIQIKPMTQIAKDYGVSDTSIRKWAKSYNIELKNMLGYWSKVKHNKI